MTDTLIALLAGSISGALAGLLTALFLMGGVSQWTDE
jgi:hypothetical protein